MGFLNTVDTLIEPLRGLSNTIASPLFDLGVRVYLGWEFFSSGLTRFADFKNGTFDNQVFLFELEHPVPGLDPTAAAYLTTGAEIILPIMLVLGLFGRFAAAGLLFMTAVIEFTYGHFDVHVLWAFLAAMIFIKGPGALSLDTLLLRFIRK
jgi:putative oxidoreductase